MTIHRLLQIIGPVCWWILFLGVAADWMWPTLTRWLPSLLCLSEFLGARPRFTAILLVCLCVSGVYLLPPPEYRRIDAELLRRLHRTPLSRLYGRSAGLLFLEIVSLMTVAVGSTGTAVYGVLELVDRDIGQGISHAGYWSYFAGTSISLLSHYSLRRYIFPLP